MKFNINKITFIATIVVLIFSFSACKNDKQNEGQSTEAKATEKAEAPHE